MKNSPAINNFNGGELSPLIAGRSDLKAYPNGCRHMRNFIPSLQGPARRRMGTRFVAEVKDSNSRTWLGRFVFNNAQSYVIEFGDRYCRFFSQHGYVAATFGNPIEIVTPWLGADLTDANGLFALRMVQTGDVLYIVHPKYEPQKLSRTGASSFTISGLTYETDLRKGGSGPYNDLDLSTLNASIWASANTGAVNLTASAAVFQPVPATPNLLVGSWIRLEQNIVNNIKSWEPGKVIAINDVRRSDGKNYHALNAATTGSVKPIHFEGAVYDGDNGVQWQYDDPGYGWGSITAITDSTHAQIATFSRLPDMVVGAGNATHRWALRAWNANNGFPDNVTIFRERLVFTRGREIWGSVAGSFEDFSDRDDGGVVTADQAFHFTTDSDRSDAIVWMGSDNQGLLLGTGASEHAVYESDPTSAFGPGNAIIRKQSEYGSRGIQPCFVDNSTIFVQTSGRKVRNLKLEQGLNIRWLSEDLGILGEHVGYSFPVPGRGVNIVGMTYQQEPDSLIWVHMADGRMAGFTLNTEQEIRGWHQHRIGGYVDLARTQFAMVESVTSIPSPDGNHNELWMIVYRNVNGVFKRYVEYMEAMRQQGDNPEDAFYVDCGLSLNNTKPASLSPDQGAQTAGTINVNFLADTDVFTAADVGKFIHRTYIVEDVQGNIIWKKSIAQITTFVNFRNVLCTIISPFQTWVTSAIASGQISSFPILDTGIGYTTQPTFSTVGGGGVGATGIASLKVVGAFQGAMAAGAGYSLGDILTVPGGVFTRPAKIRVIGLVAGGGGGIANMAIADPGDYSTIPGVIVPFGGANLVQIAGLTGGTGAGAGFTAEFGLSIATVTNGGGTPYTGIPTVAIAGGGLLGRAAQVTATINATTIVPSGGLPSASGHLVSFPISDAGVGFTSPPAISAASGAAGSTTIGVVGCFQGAMGAGAGYALGDVLTVPGGTASRSAKIRVTGVAAGGGGAVTNVNIADSGDYTVIPGTIVPFSGVNLVQVPGLTGGAGAGAGITLVFGVVTTLVTNRGLTEYSVPPAATVSGGGLLGKNAVVTSVIDSLVVSAGVQLLLMGPGDWRLSATVITGLSHLEGQLVDICADGAAHPQRVVQGGSITLQAPASKVHIGLPCPAVLQPMPIEVPMAGGTSEGRTKRASRVTLRFHDSAGCKYGKDEILGKLDVVNPVAVVNPADVTVGLFTGDALVSWPDGYDGQLLLSIIQDKPLPCTVAAIIPRMNTEEDR